MAMKDLAGDGIRFARDISNFKARTFSGAEVLEITDYLGAGVGATLAAAKRVELSRSGQITEADYDDPPAP